MRKVKNVLILAGGDSTRFWPLKNKTFWQFFGKPFIQHLVEELNAYTQNIFIVANPQLMNEFEKLGNVKIIAQDIKLPGMAGAIMSTKDKITGEILILNSNDWFEFKAISDLIAKVDREKLDFAFLAKKMQSYFPGGYLQFKEGKVVGIIEKPHPDNVPSNFVNLVVDYFSNYSMIISALEKTKTSADDWYEHALSYVIKSKALTDFIEYKGEWNSLKYPWHVLSVMRQFLTSLGKEVRLGKNVKISDTAKIVGPCFIDDNSIVGDFVMIRESHIGKNCLVGGYSEVTRSYLGDGVALHRNYVGDSVLGNEVSFGAQAATANYRFDGKNIVSNVAQNKVDSGKTKLGALIGDKSRVGVNATIIPGIKIGHNTFVGPNEVVDSDLEDNLFKFRGKKVQNKNKS